MSEQSVTHGGIKRTFSRDELEDLGIPYEAGRNRLICTEQVASKRWATVHHAVFRVDEDGPLWRVTYYEGATEEQECDTWGYGTEPDEITAVQVEPYTVEVIRYRPVSAAS